MFKIKEQEINLKKIIEGTLATDYSEIEAFGFQEKLNVLSNALLYVRNMTVETDDDAAFRAETVAFCDKLLLSLANTPNTAGHYDLRSKFKDVYTLSPNMPFTNQELMKERNLNGYFLSKRTGGHHHLAFGSLDIDYTFEKYVSDIELRRIKREDFNLNTYKEYIVQNADKMDILILHSPCDASAYFQSIYRSCRKNGKVLIATDTNRQHIASGFYMTPEYVQPFFCGANVVTIPAHNLRDIQNRNKENKFPTFTLRHSFANATGEDLSLTPADKENIILTAGNLDFAVKNVYSLVHAFSVCADLIPDWKLVLAGGLSNDLIRDILKTYPQIKKRIVFTGALEKAELYKQYKAAKIFCMPTFCDVTPNVCSEALAMGCYQILSDSMDGAEDLTRGGEYGVVYEQEKYIVHPELFRYDHIEGYKLEAERNLANALVEAAHRLDYNFFKEFIPKAKKLQQTEFDYGINARIMSLLLTL
jgi:glycosyltransferase involved in cell wall biosynthesis